METRNQKIFFAFSALVLALSLFAPTALSWFSGADKKAELIEVQELGWEDLVPEDYIPPSNPLDTMSQIDIDKLFDGSPESEQRLAEIQMSLSYAPTVPELNGKDVKIPGFVVPLDYDGQTEMTEFLLVPYFGACIHSPPPPANQVVLVRSESSLTIEDIYDPIWVIGSLHTETFQSELAEAGYTLDIHAIEPYRRQQ